MEVISLSSVVVVAGLALILVAAVCMLVYERRQKRQLQALVVRLGEIEKVRSDDESAGHTADHRERQSEPPNSDHSSSDPLAGMTTHVQLLVAGGMDFEAATLADQAITVVHQHLEESFLPGALASELNVSIRTLERGLVHALSCTPGQLITAMKMREARRLLASGRYRVTEVASRLAFSSPQYFSRRFKAFFGHSPSHISRDT